MAHKIEIKNVYKIFGHSPERAIDLLKQGKSKDEIMKKTHLSVGVADASFHIDEGEIVVVMGLSGSGKSTLLRCINRLITPTSGTVMVEGVDVTALSHEELRVFRQKHFGMVFQHFALFPHRTVVKNIEFGLEIQKIDAKQRRDRAMQALEQVGLKGWEDSYPSQLSGGMQQRVGLARALALDADVMLMDEAFSALDPLIRKEMQDELIALEDTVKKTIVFISHDLDEALKLGDRIVLMKDGEIVQQGTGETILQNPASSYVAKFVEDVDMSKVLKAESVMLKPAEQAYLEIDGPKVALHKMRHAGISSIFVRQDHRFAGLITVEQAAAALKRGDTSLEKCLLSEEVVKVDPATPAVDLFPLMAKSNFPIAVVEPKDQKLIGVITKGSLISALAERGDVDDQEDDGMRKNRQS
ncbi:glycine/betaine ABC transporter ATP-binding protein [candidate division KSB3 bacterium]|uniref:Glycine/betaine ABC transporter ATP-binding protein n=1 Tax=candidate division KSB3 bacterium TaxID=2044937 RepID=A0A2G6E3B6_9BACT|nr:MAG: glycine/betaine ABC transporter ATP-binding protein [candidate division KSB3 bacterium]PIE28823.1 MAG: glycine/betaine ABC transporter ATP-binding protein [candidate division KSB3 bacterium]